MKRPNPWTSENWKGNKFEINTCKGAEAYIKHKTGLCQIQVHKTERYLVVTYVLSNGIMNVEKIQLPAGVLYCLEETDFEPLFNKITNG